MTTRILKEACVETFEEAQYAWERGSDFLEVCSRLDLEGLTPEWDLIRKINENSIIPFKIMIRPRKGNFEYTSKELNGMADSIQHYKSINPYGFVLGCTKKDFKGHTTLDLEAIEYLCKIAEPFPVTLHKAIDICVDIEAEIHRLKAVRNLKYILSSGGATTATEGAEMLRKMQNWAHPHIQIIAAGKITAHNILELSNYLGLVYFHGRKIV